jgi:hypothetical protein
MSYKLSLFKLLLLLSFPTKIYAADIDYEKEEFPLHLAATEGDMDALRQLLGDNVVAINEANNFFMTPLHCAVVNGNLKAASFLLKKGANIEEQDEMEQTALHLAVIENDFQMVDLLLRRNANPFAVTENRSSALLLAAENADFELVSLLIDYNINPNFSNEDEIVPLHLAAQYNEFSVVSLLLEKGALVNQQNSDNRTALHLAIRDQRWENAKLLIRWGANFYIADNEGYLATGMLPEDPDNEIFWQIKEIIIWDIYNIILSHAFSKGNPFKEEILKPLIMNNPQLLTSLNKEELSRNFNKILKENLKVSHLNITYNQKINNSNSPTSMPQKAIIANLKFEDFKIISIRFDSFNKTLFDQTKQLLLRAKNQNLNIFLDLRYNSGGAFETLREFLGLFLEPGTPFAAWASKNLVAQKYNDIFHDYEGKELFDSSARYFQTNPTASRIFDRTYSAKIAILVGPRTASAAENFAYALKLNRMATIIGSRTAGCALLAQIHTVPSGITIQLPIGEIIFADGTSLEGNGLTPDLSETERLQEILTKWLKKTN